MPDMSKSPAVDRAQLLRIAAATLEALESRRFSEVLAESAPEEAVPASGVPRDIVANSLSAALDWARLEQELIASEVSLEGPAAASVNIPYLPSNQVLGVLQSAD